MRAVVLRRYGGPNDLEYTIATPGMIAPKPASLDWGAAAGLPLVGLTAVQTLDAVRVEADDTLLIHGAAGGVGTVAVQVALARGARVIATASPRNHDFLAGLGAEPVAYGDGLRERVRELAPDGIDAALDTVGRRARPLGRGRRHAWSRVVSVADPAIRERGGHYLFVEPSDTGLRTLTTLVDAGELTVPIARTLPLARAAEAWQSSQTGRTRGKIILTID